MSLANLMKEFSMKPALSIATLLALAGNPAFAADGINIIVNHISTTQIQAYSAGALQFNNIAVAEGLQDGSSATITVDQATLNQTQTRSDGAYQAGSIGWVSNLQGNANVEVNAHHVAINQTQTDAPTSEQTADVGRVDWVDGASIGINVSDIDITQKQTGLSGGRQLVQVGAVIGDVSNPVHANTNIAVMGKSIVQEQTASNNATQTVRMGVLTNGAYYP
ncbi:MAG: hypothetical protein BWK73_32435 [Thiothrix lacustris]|uniref:Adhesin n=1 Tax=Thiothrix lacustris TaxID=525917 RepID=A0A1Y1QHY5_9GAMM|nr:MAG: hypothetical protein BWK73_32435 [Thiothrix lacustris]